MRGRWRPARRGGRLLALLLVGAVIVGACGTVRVTYEDASEGAGIVGAVAGPTLGLFWRLAEVQVRNPAVAPALLASDPRGPAEELERLGIELEAFRDELAEKHGVRSAVLFVAKDQDSLEAARADGVEVTDLSNVAFLSGPEVDTLVVFQAAPVSVADDSRAEISRFAAGPRVASLGRFPPPGVLSSGVSGPMTDSGLKSYRVRPRTWRPESVFTHVRCGVDAGVELVTRLVYRGGSQDPQAVDVSAPDLQPCPLSTAPGAKAAIVEQPGRKRPGGPVIIAASYVLDPYPGPLLADWIEVP